jgi:cytoskeleton protein RodZ
MNEPLLSDSETTAPSPLTAASMTSGAMLRKAREAQGLHIGALAVSLKVPVKKLEALESDRFDLLPDTVFVRALASSVCRVLKTEPGPILEKLPHTTAPQLKDSGAGINVPFHSAGGGSLRQFWDQLSKPIVTAVTVLLAGALLLIFLPFSRQAEVADGAKSLALESSSQLAAPAVAVSVPALAAQPPIQAASAMLSATPELAQVAGSGATSGILVFKAQALAWVEVVDAGGVVQVRRNMAAGETVGVSGSLPLMVVVGRSDTTQVLVRGQVFDLLSIAKDNVARFEVK